MATLADRVAAKWEDAPDEAERAGPAAAESLVPLASSPDEEVRALAYACLGRSGGPVAARALVAALRDPSDAARTVAVRGVVRQATAGLVPDVLLALDAVEEADLREHLVLAVGKLEGWDPALLRKRREKEPHPSVREAELVAMARAGDALAAEELSRLLVESPPEHRPRLIRRAQYVARPWLLRSLAPYLEDWSPAKRLNEELGPPDYLRVCDLAVDLVCALTGRRFTGAPKKLTNYPLSTLEEVRAYLEALP